MQPVLPEKAARVVFANIDDILLFNTVLLSDLEERQRQSRLYIDTIGDVVDRHMGGVGQHYRGYCMNQANAARTLRDLRRSDRSLNTLLDVRVALLACHGATLRLTIAWRTGSAREKPRARALSARTDAACHAVSPTH